MAQAKRRKSPRYTEPITKLTVRIPVTLDQEIYALADQERIAISDMVTRLLREALAARARPPRVPGE